MSITSTGGETHSAQHPGKVLSERLCRLLDTPQTTLLAILHATHVVKQQVAEGVIHECIHSEITRLHVVLPWQTPRLVQVLCLQTPLRICSPFQRANKSAGHLHMPFCLACDQQLAEWSTAIEQSKNLDSCHS